MRIAINNELEALEKLLVEAPNWLMPGGIVGIISFHSLEDRIVKNFFNLYSSLKSNPSRYFPEQNDKINLFKSVSKKALLPSREELHENIRSRSAKLRYAIRNNNTFVNTEEFENKFLKYSELESTTV